MEPGAGVGSVTKRLVGRLSAAAQTDLLPSAESKGFPFGVYDLIIPFNADGTVGGNQNFCWHVIKVNRRASNFVAASLKDQNDFCAGLII